MGFLFFSSVTVFLFFLFFHPWGLAERLFRVPEPDAHPLNFASFLHFFFFFFHAMPLFPRFFLHLFFLLLPAMPLFPSHLGGARSQERLCLSCESLRGGDRTRLWGLALGRPCSLMKRPQKLPQMMSGFLVFSFYLPGTHPDFLAMPQPPSSPRMASKGANGAWSQALVSAPCSAAT